MNLIFIFLSVAGLCAAQFPSGKNAAKSYPEKFTIKEHELKALFSYRPGEKVSKRTNKFLAKGIVLANTRNGDVRFLRLKLVSFQNAYLNVQINGTFSTQVFIVSDDKSVFYKGKMEKSNWIMTKCDEDEIISE